MRAHRRLTALTVALLLLAGCGDDGLSDAHREQLAGRIDAARKTARARDADGAEHALLSFRRDVRAARDRGELSDADAERLLTGAVQASRRVRAEVRPRPTPTPSPTPTPTPAATVAPAPPAPAPGKKPKKGKAKGHDKGPKR